MTSKPLISNALLNLSSEGKSLKSIFMLRTVKTNAHLSHPNLLLGVPEARANVTQAGVTWGTPNLLKSRDTFREPGIDLTAFRMVLHYCKCNGDGYGICNKREESDNDA